MTTQAPRSIEKCHIMITYSMTTQAPKKHCIMITDAYSSTYNKRILHHDYIFQMTTQTPKIKKKILHHDYIFQLTFAISATWAAKCMTADCTPPATDTY